MPVYEYKHKKSQANCADPFEIIELTPAEPLKKCPKCKKPVERVLSRFTSHKNILSNSNLKDKGFSKFVKDGQGGYRKEV